MIRSNIIALSAVASGLAFAAATDEGSAAPAAQTGLKSLMIAEVTFEAPFKFQAGHVLSEAEARTLNQTRFENLRNNFAPKVKASKEGKEGAIPADQLAAEFAKFEAAYEFSMPGAGGTSTRSLDPIEREALAIARDVVKAKLAERGQSYNPPKDVSDEQKDTYKKTIADKVAEVAARDEIIALAKKNVAARDKGLASISAALEL